MQIETPKMRCKKNAKKCIGIPPPNVKMVHVTQTCPFIATIKGNKRQGRCKKVKQNTKDAKRPPP